MSRIERLRTWWFDKIWNRLHPTALFFALASLWIAISPSLITRDWWMNLANIGLCMGFGYLVGRTVGYLGSRLAQLIGLQVTLKPGVGRILTRVFQIGLTIGTLVWWVISLREQDKIAVLTGMVPNAAVNQSIGLITGLMLFGLLVMLGRAIAALVNRLSGWLGRILPAGIGSIIAVLVVFVVSVVLTNNVLVTGVLDGAFRSATATNETTLPGRSQPLQPERSGSAQSLEPWNTLGAQGQAVVSDGPRAADISRATGRPAKEPIRAFAGIREGRDVYGTADAVVAELRRTGAFERKYLVVMTSAGKGWLEEWNLSAVEFLADGDSAIASMQYSYMLSPFAYMADRTIAPRAGQALFNAVYAAWSQLPADHRPMLLAGGTSLGSYGGQAAFADEQEMIAKVEGAVWVGTPRFTPLWSKLTEHRRPDSPEIAPVWDNGRNIRFVTQPAELRRDFYGGPYDPWDGTRVIYLQYASDPIVWWNWDVLYREHDWLKERVGRDVSDGVRWVPWATFWQLACDMAVAQSAGDGHGHEYKDDLVPVWAEAMRITDANIPAIQQGIRPLIKAR
ncbi:alpha/beta hydrolase [Granulicoccus phenolivorans]|uniref:alpha/beta hydrolase n=1 Tax=Granulicoccus phenolivorans TaxID=266854 RepID=UPI0003F9222D|nr:alpha/beta-hydrolase family protein [Granulicoccus phenolivorans]